MARSPGEVIARGTRSAVRAYGRGAVIKVPDAATSERWIHCEAAYAEAARLSGAPVPRHLGVERIDGRAASVWDRVQGTSLWQQTVDTPRRSPQLGAVLAEVHEQLFGLIAPVTLPSQRDRLVTKIRLAAATLDPGHAEALELLPQAGKGAAHLCHGDLHPSNVILSPRGPMIVDWFDASRGDPIGDIARSTLVLLAHGADPPPRDRRADAGAERTRRAANCGPGPARPNRSNLRSSRPCRRGRPRCASGHELARARHVRVRTAEQAVDLPGRPGRCDHR